MIDSVYTNPLLEIIHEVGPHVRAPTSCKLSNVFRPEAAKKIKQWIAEFTPNGKKGYHFNVWWLDEFDQIEHY